MMNDETPEKVARDMIAQADILAMMGQQPLSSLKVIEQLKKFAERILNAVNPDEHAARMDPETARATETNDAPPWIDTDGELTIGCLVGENRVTSYVISDRHCVTVTAGLETPPDAESFWSGAGTVDGRRLVSFRVRGSRGLVNLVCRNVRNAIKSKIDKHRRQKANKAAKASAGKAVAQ